MIATRLTVHGAQAFEEGVAEVADQRATVVVRISSSCFLISGPVREAGCHELRTTCNSHASKGSPVRLPDPVYSAAAGRTGALFIGAKRPAVRISAQLG